MKIGSINPIVGQYNKIKLEAAYHQPQAQPATDRVELSREAMLFSEAFSAVRKSMQEAAPGQEVKVGRIMEQMAGGAYEVELQAICDKLLS